jgi:hypothetical protein
VLCAVVKITEEEDDDWVSVWLWPREGRCGGNINIMLA